MANTSRNMKRKRGQHPQHISSLLLKEPQAKQAASPRRLGSTVISEPAEHKVGPFTKRRLKEAGTYRRRRLLGLSLVGLATLVAVLAAFMQTKSWTGKQELPIDPNSAAPDVVLATAAGTDISSPIRPEDLTGLGYHPDGDRLLGLSPRGRNLSTNPLFRLLSGGSTPEKIQYYVMDPAGRPGPNTGALDVGAEAGTAVYAPITGTVTAVRTDPELGRSASVVEIKPGDNPDVRVSVSLIQDIDGGIAPEAPVTAGATKLGSVADPQKVLKPQLASLSDDGDHVTVAVSKPE